MTINSNDEKDASHPVHPANDTYIRSPLYYNDGDGNENEPIENDKQCLIQQSTNNNKSKRRTKPSNYSTSNSTSATSYRRPQSKSILQSLPSFILQKKLINLRSILLATSLALILLVFWLLDSLKDPTFAIMVEGNLHKHQPLAKMASVGGTLIIVVLMEIVSHGKNQKRQKRHNGLSKEEIESGGGVWTKMDVTSSLSSQQSVEQDDENDQKIPIGVFRIVGIAYIVAFGILSYLISLHPDVRSNGIPAIDGEDVDTIVATNAGDLHTWKNHSVWYILGYLQYVTIESYGSIAVATFWSFSNSTLTLKAAKTYYGFIIAMAQVGAIGGSTIATIQNVSIPKLFLVACFGILIQMAVMHVYGMYFPFAMNEEDDIVFFDEKEVKDYEDEFNKKLKKTRRRNNSDSNYNDNMKVVKDSDDSFATSKIFLSGVFLIMKHNYLLLILGVSCLYEVSLTCLDYEMKLMGLDRFTAPPDVLGGMNNEPYSDYTTTAATGAATAEDSKGSVDAFTIFMGRYGQLTNLLSLLLSYYLFPYLMERYGLKYTIRLFPTLLCFVIMTTFVALPMNLPVLFVSMSILKAMTYSINDPAKEILYIPTSNVVKFKAKFWIDVVGARIAKAIGSSINTYAGTAERIVQYGSFPSVVTSVALWVVCYAAGMKFDELLERGEIVGLEDDEIQNSQKYYNENDNDNDDNDDDTCESDCFINPNYTSESGWESNVSVELVEAK